VKTLAWVALLWGEIAAIAVVWVSFRYRDPESNRLSAWLFGHYRRLSGDPPGGGADYARERMLQNVWICGSIALLGLFVIVKELVK
jgi:hypothetical protein